MRFAPPAASQVQMRRARKLQQFQWWLLNAAAAANNDTVWLKSVH
jgi:hypothetical protein